MYNFECLKITQIYDLWDFSVDAFCVTENKNKKNTMSVQII